uniref:Ankyrin repeat protein n=1 Tax=Marseillevirus LCMAC102 TaxID=2506603 RepID=A0A481YV18_9VIRU|nr:MAG: ankyrin repeat protein [Marseillevirus LCMAC102]
MYDYDFHTELFDAVMETFDCECEYICKCIETGSIKAAVEKPTRVLLKKYQNKYDINKYIFKNFLDDPMSPIDYIIYNGTYFLIIMLIDDFGLDPNKVLSYKKSSVISASIALSKRADPNNVDKKGCTPLHMVQDIEVISFLLKNGADPHIKNKKKEIPLVTQLRHNNITAAEELLHCSDVKNSLKHLLPANGIVDWLLQRGAKPSTSYFARMIIDKDNLMVSKLVYNGAPIDKALCMVKKLWGIDNSSLIISLKHRLDIYRKYFDKWREYVKKKKSNDWRCIQCHCSGAEEPDLSSCRMVYACTKCCCEWAKWNISRGYLLHTLHHRRPFEC